MFSEQKISTLVAENISAFIQALSVLSGILGVFSFLNSAKKHEKKTKALILFACFVVLFIIAKRIEKSQQDVIVTPTPSTTSTSFYTSTPMPTSTPIIGKIVSFGKYEQDDNSYNGKENINWIVLKEEGNQVLLLSYNNLDVMPYHNRNESVIWENSRIRSWLNNDFLNNAFDYSERAAIISKVIDNPSNPYTNIGGGRPTQDRIFLLSIDEVSFLLRNQESRRAQNTAYAHRKKVAIQQDKKEYSGYGNWWLRTSGNRSDYAAAVYTTGEVDYVGNGVDLKTGYVRPALWYDWNIRPL